MRYREAILKIERMTIEYKKRAMGPSNPEQAYDAAVVSTHREAILKYKKEAIPLWLVDELLFSQAAVTCLV